MMTDTSESELLAVIGFADQAVRLAEDKPYFQVAMPTIDHQMHWEVWHSTLPVSYGRNQQLLYSFNDEVLFGHLLIDEKVGQNIEQVSEYAYKQVFELLKQADYPYLLRIWNYFPAINQDQDEMERYRLFCLGRQAALDVHGNFAYSPPAATAIGTLDHGFQLYFLAAKQPGMQLENPRQVSAFLYPRQYGPVSPAFSRATVKQWSGDQQHLYISGTASIVGHETLHQNNVLKQLAETMQNIESLVEHGHQTLHLPIMKACGLSLLKVYIRDASDFSLVKSWLTSYFANQALSPAILYVQGDVCRADLLIEIEAIYA